MISAKSANEKTRLNVCVCGWYYPDDWYASLLRLQEKGIIQVFIVAHRDHPLLDLCGLPYDIRENTGLEWGAYNHYLMKQWPGGNIIFCHDDMAFGPVVIGDKVVAGEDIFYRLADLGDIDQGYVFTSREEDVINWGKHGRMVYISAGLASWCKQQGGFWHDQDNSRNYNAGVNEFDEMMKKALRVGYDTRNKIYFPGLVHGYRGEFKGRAIL